MQFNIKIKKRFIKELLSTSIVVLMMLASFAVLFVENVKAQPPSPNEIIFIPSQLNVTVGDIFNIPIYLNVSWEMDNVTITNVTFEPTGILNYTTTTQGNLFSGGTWLTPESPGSFPEGGIYNNSGYAKPIIWNNTAAKNNTYNETANITWYAYGVGSVYINITGATYNDSGTNYTTTINNGTVLIHPQWPSNFTETRLSSTQIRLNFTQGIGADRTIIVRANGSIEPPGNITDGYELYNDTGAIYVDSGLTPNTDYSYSAWGWNSTEDLYSLQYSGAGTRTYQGGPGWFIQEHYSDVTDRYIENNTEKKFNFSFVSETGGPTQSLHNLTIILPQNLTYVEATNGTTVQGGYIVNHTSHMIMWNATDYANGFLCDGIKYFWFNASALGPLESLQFQIIAYNNYSEYQSFYMTVFITTNFSFTGSIVDINGNALQGATANITVSSFSDSPPITLGYFTKITNATGHFNVTRIPTTVEDVSSLQSGLMGPGGASSDLFYLLSAIEYEPTNTYAINISTSLSSLPIGEFVTMINNPEIYLKPAISFRVNVTGPNYNWSSKQIDNYTAKNFMMMVKDLRLGYSVKELNTRAYDQIFSVPAGRNYSLSIFPDQSFPVSIRFYNITSACQAGGDFNISGVNTTCMPYNGTYLVNVSVNVSYNHRWLNGSFNGINDITEMGVVAYIMEDQDMIFENWALPFNLGNESGGSDDSYNTATGVYNISLPATMASSYIMLRAYAKNSSGNYYMGSHIVSSSGGNLSESIYNFTMSPLINGISRSITSNNVSNNWSETVIANTTAVLFNLVNSTGSLLSNENAFIDIKRELDSVDYMYMADAQNGQFNISLTQGSSLKKLTIYSQQYAPVSTYVSSNILSGIESTTTVSCSNGVCNITMRSFGDFDPLGESKSFSMGMYTSNSTCNVPNPLPICDLCGAQNESEFSPFNAILKGDISLMISSWNTSVYYLNVDLLASGPPDACFDNGSEIGGGLQAAWQFGSQGPDIYDSILIKMPYNDSLHNRTIKVSIPVLYDNEFNAIWNSSINSTSDILTDPRLSDYADYLNTSYEAYLNGTGVICNESDNTLSSGIGYKDKTNRTVWIKIPHFSGVGPLIGGDAPDPPSSFTATKSGTSQIDLSWTKGSKADYTHIRRKTGSYPTSITDGTNVTYITGTSKSDTGLSEDTRYYYSAWSWNITEQLWSTSYATSSAKTDPEGGNGNGDGIPPTNIKPTADANGPYSGYVNTIIQFDGSGSTDPDGTITSFSWDYGDGETGSGMISNHTYKAVGNYTITLTVTDIGGLTDIDITTAAIEEEPTEDNPPEISNIVRSPKKVTSEDNVNISADVIDDIGLSSVILYWNNGLFVQYKTMNNIQGDTYSAMIGPFTKGGTISYWVKATDTNNQSSTSSSKSFSVYAPAILEEIGNISEYGEEIVIEGSYINHINIKPIKKLQNVNITIENVTEVEIFAINYAGDGVVFKYFNFTITANDTYVEDEDIDSLTIGFKVETAWINSENIDKEKVSLMRYHNNVWEMLNTSYLSEDDNYVYYEAVMLGLSTFAIVGTKIILKEEPIPAIEINYVYIILIVIAIVILIIAILFKIGVLYIEEEKYEEKPKKKKGYSKKIKK